ncbi:MAG: acyl-CoA dehydrogenase, partial [Verrucomicrobiaceae bacterium]|nr:acyl-CoA dehydrogenase [Verrucomicrobiaceae bacterium]
DKDKNADVRLEAAIGKLWGSERTWEIVNDTMQLRGGRGYETADSLHERGELAEPVERLFRDARINTIFEGSSEIMRLFIAREALDPHLKVGAEAVNATLPMKQRVRAALRAAKFYSVWLPVKYVPRSIEGADGLHPVLRKEMREVERLSRKLARRLFFAMVLNGPSLEKKQVLLGRFVDIGAELFVLASTLSYAQSKITEASHERPEMEHTLRMTSYFAKLAKEKVAGLFRAISSNADSEGYTVAKGVMA